MALGMSMTDAQLMMLPSWSHLGAVRPPPGLEHMEAVSLQLQLLKALEVAHVAPSTLPKVVGALQPQKVSQPQKFTQKCGFWSEEFGLHPDSVEWLSSTKMMIRNVPARCTELELRVYLSTQTTDDFVLEMPKTSPAKCKGYAFVQMADSVALAALAKALWQQTVPTRKSARPFKIHPAESSEKLPLSLEPFSFLV
ncbi:unnamed protein product [Symbiodinium sp. CCMP2456]|nr:unnamed protein product [Symbiodinium sp. CCMP2456]